LAAQSKSNGEGGGWATGISDDAVCAAGGKLTTRELFKDLLRASLVSASLIMRRLTGALKAKYQQTYRSQTIQ
jgi:hypothetical protein